MEYIMDWKNRIRNNTPAPDLIEDILADSNELSAIVGRSEIGKTNLALHLAYSLSTGTPFLGFNVSRPVPVGYIGFEDDEHKFLEHIEKIEKQFPEPVGTLWIDHAARIFRLEDNQKSKDSFATLTKGMRVLIVDPVRYIVPGDYTKPDIATAFLATLHEVIQVNGLLVIIVVYFKKMDAKGLMEPGDLWSMKGATEWGDTCATVMMLEREPQGHHPTGGFAPVDKDKAVLHFAKTRHAREVHPPIKLRFSRAKCLFDKV